MSKVYIFGLAGNMASRYIAILSALGHEWLGEDIAGLRKGSLDEADAVIVATPTDTHDEILNRIKTCGKPILCEKPICKDMTQLRRLMAELVLAGTRLQMVSQYDYLVDPRPANGQTVYDYYRTGSDGLIWDCIQIVGLSRDKPVLRNVSPIWTCIINGRRLDLADMDGAYVSMIRDWMAAPRNDISRILDTHEKVASLEAECRTAS